MPEATPDNKTMDRSARLAALLVEEAHISIWAADRELRIVLWNSGAEHIYGLSRKDALGKRYLELFIDEAEREQSRADCLHIIDTGYRQFNCLAYDHSGSSRRYMLTNCFRIRDPETGEAFQAEIGVEISDLELKVNEHRNLREVGIERLAAKRQSFDHRRNMLVDRVEALKTEIIRIHALRQYELNSWRSSALDSPEKQNVILPIYEAKMAELESDYTEDARVLGDLREKVTLAENIEDLDLLGQRCEVVAHSFHLLRGGSK